MISLYHYTSKENAEKIEKSGFIKQSLMKDGDAILGDGVYLTGIAPGDKSKFKIVENNWDDQNLTEKQYLEIVNQGKIECVIKVTVTTEQYKKSFKSMQQKYPKDPRNVHVHPGDLPLKNFQVEIKSFNAFVPLGTLFSPIDLFNLLGPLALPIAGLAISTRGIAAH